MRALAILALTVGPALAGDVCHDIDANDAWQTVAFPSGLVQDIRNSGFWTVDADLTPAGTQGHGGMDAKSLTTDRPETRPLPSAQYGALLVRFQAGDTAQVMDWARFHGAVSQSGTFNMNIGEIAFRINEGDADLADNDGTMTVCFRYID